MKKVFLISTILGIWACSNNKNSNEQIISEAIDTTSQVSKISDQAIGDIIRSIPSPIEISMLIKESGGAYDSKILNPTENKENYNTSYKRALNLGMYGTDLGYINIYNKSKDALVYLDAIKTMADELNIGQFYDFNTIKRLASNSNNIDSLLYITTSNFQHINEFLHKEKRSDQSVLLLTGGWLEAVYISCNVAVKTKNKELYEKIGEQKIVLNQLLLLLSNFKSDPSINLLNNQLLELNKIFNQVEISYTYKESSMKEVNGVLVIEDQSESKVIISDEQVNSILNTVKTIRDGITS
ncbi:MAG: hypothetical protein EAZ07_08020 [Cytophagales bacterium]|nr:MAG: hypothetical protein EAZ07_08020 [Cytophagales bacterium]